MTNVDHQYIYLHMYREWTNQETLSQSARLPNPQTHKCVRLLFAECTDKVCQVTDKVYIRHPAGNVQMYRCSVT